MTTREAPVCVLVPPGAREPLAAPKPAACSACGGAPGPDPDFDAPGGCEACRGTGVAPARFDLRPSRSHELRRVVYTPEPGGGGVLRVGLAKTKRSAIVWSEYAVFETPNDWGGRSWVVAKKGSDRRHNVFIGGAVSCECEGHTYVTSAKHNQRAYEAGEKTFPSFGCLHADALHALLLGGYFDLS